MRLLLRAKSGLVDNIHLLSFLLLLSSGLSYATCFSFLEEHFIYMHYVSLTLQIIVFIATHLQMYLIFITNIFVMSRNDGNRTNRHLNVSSNMNLSCRKNILPGICVSSPPFIFNGRHEDVSLISLTCNIPVCIALMSIKRDSVAIVFYFSKRSIYPRTILAAFQIEC